MLPLQGSVGAVVAQQCSRARAQAAGDCGATSRVEIYSPERPPVQAVLQGGIKIPGTLSREESTRVGHQTVKP